MSRNLGTRLNRVLERFRFISGAAVDTLRGRGRRVAPSSSHREARISQVPRYLKNLCNSSPRMLYIRVGSHPTSSLRCLRMYSKLSNILIRATPSIYAAPEARARQPHPCPAVRCAVPSDGISVPRALVAQLRQFVVRQVLVRWLNLALVSPFVDARVREPQDDVDAPRHARERERHRVPFDIPGRLARGAGKHRRQCFGTEYTTCVTGQVNGGKLTRGKTP